MSTPASTSRWHPVPTAGLIQRTVDSPVGPLLLAANDAGLTHLLFASAPHSLGLASSPGDASADSIRAERAPSAAEATLSLAVQQLDEYFSGRRTRFDLPLAAAGTEFQQAVWTALTHIPYGGTYSYGELAARIGRPRAVRAVGLANGRNPISIVVPCHRVIGANGALTGYGGGLERKRFLLELETSGG